MSPDTNSNNHQFWLGMSAIFSFQLQNKDRSFSLPDEVVEVQSDDSEAPIPLSVVLPVDATIDDHESSSSYGELSFQISKARNPRYKATFSAQEDAAIDTERLAASKLARFFPVEEQCHCNGYPTEMIKCPHLQGDPLLLALLENLPNAVASLDRVIDAQDDKDEEEAQIKSLAAKIKLRHFKRLRPLVHMHKPGKDVPECHLIDSFLEVAGIDQSDRPTKPSRFNPGDSMEHGEHPFAEHRKVLHAKLSLTESKPVNDIGSFCVNASMWSNILLLVLKSVAYASSKSMAVLASLLDSVLDILSGIVLWAAVRFEQKTGSDDKSAFPVGRRRAQTMGVLAFACVMLSFALQLIWTCLGQLIAGEVPVAMSFDLLPLSIIGFTIILKLALYLLCQRGAKTSQKQGGACEAYASDHRNDVLTNIVGMAAAWAGSKYVWWLDPVGSMLLSLYVLVDWAGTAIEQFTVMIGRAAESSVVDRIKLVANNYHPLIKRTSFVQAVHVGKEVTAEVHVILPNALTVAEAHSVAEGLQMEMELLLENVVERCYVHIESVECSDQVFMSRGYL